MTTPVGTDAGSDPGGAPGAAEAFQISPAAAEAYEADFVPAFFAQWAPVLCRAAGIEPGHRVLDVACGTGIVARTAADLVGPDHVVGVDLNPAMLAVAARIAPRIGWQQGDVAALPVPDGAFDVVTCQMALMFFPDPDAALRELARAVAPGGRVAVLVPSGLAAQAAYGPFVEMAAEHAGAHARQLLGSYFACGDPQALRDLLVRAGLDVTLTAAHAGTARFASVDALVETEVRSTPLGELISDRTYRQIRDGARRVLAPFSTPDGRLDAPFECQVVVGHRR
jgi:SAM-dependent methyltransferase